MRARWLTGLVVLASGLATSLAGCGGGGGTRGSSTAPASTPASSVPVAPPKSTPATPQRPDLPADLDVSFAGVGARGAWVIRRRKDAPVVLFLHGWGAVDPTGYGPWLAHLARGGSTVVYPVYQDAPFLAPRIAFAGVVAGVRAALTAEHLPRQRWIVAGHSAGGAMSADYAASAARLGLPPAAAIFAAYPGRQIRRIPLKLPEVDPAGIPRTTRVVALYSPIDMTVGDTTAKRTIARAHVRSEQLVRITDPAVEDHLGPQRAGPASRRAFWRRLDTLIARVRG